MLRLDHTLGTCFNLWADANEHGCRPPGTHPNASAVASFRLFQATHACQAAERHQRRKFAAKAAPAATSAASTSTAASTSITSSTEASTASTSTAASPVDEEPAAGAAARLRAREAWAVPPLVSDAGCPV